MFSCNKQSCCAINNVLLLALVLAAFFVAMLKAWVQRPCARNTAVRNVWQCCVLCKWVNVIDFREVRHKLQISLKK